MIVLEEWMSDLKEPHRLVVGPRGAIKQEVKFASDGLWHPCPNPEFCLIRFRRTSPTKTLRRPAPKSSHRKRSPRG